MVEGLELFASHFSPFIDNYVLIGGAACDLAMIVAGTGFRATRDLDIVLFLDTNKNAFAKSFWTFVKNGGYENRQRPNGKPEFYRFMKPAVAGYPSMLELFSNVPDSLSFEGSGEITPIPMEESISSLSAILLNTDYSNWIRAGKVVSEGIGYARAEHLIPLKVRAWLDLSQRKQQGQPVDSRDIKKHKNDIFRLMTVVDPGYRSDVPATISDDMRLFVKKMPGEQLDLKSLGFRDAKISELLEQLTARYVT